MDAGLEREPGYHARLLLGQLLEALGHPTGLLVGAGQIQKETRVTRLGTRERTVEAAEVALRECVREELEPLVRSGLDETAHQEPVCES